MKGVKATTAWRWEHAAHLMMFSANAGRLSGDSETGVPPVPVRRVRQTPTLNLGMLPVQQPIPLQMDWARLKNLDDDNYERMCASQRKKDRYAEIRPFRDNMWNDPKRVPYFNGSKFQLTPRVTVIAMQAPLRETMDDFCYLALRDRVSAIVTLGPATFNGPKDLPQAIFPYWFKYETDHFNLLGTEHAVLPMTTLHHCRLQIRPKKSSVKSMLSCFQMSHKQHRDVKHIHYEHWLDASVPPSVPEFINLVKYVAAFSQRPGPIVVHCSAGVGRTGTFLAALKLLLDGKRFTPDNVRDTVAFLKKQRRCMVQSDDQWQFLNSLCERSELETGCKLVEVTEPVREEFKLSVATPYTTPNYLLEEGLEVDSVAQPKLPPRSVDKLRRSDDLATTTSSETACVAHDSCDVPSAWQHRLDAQLDQGSCEDLTYEDPSVYEFVTPIGEDRGSLYGDGDSDYSEGDEAQLRHSVRAGPASPELTQTPEGEADEEEDEDRLPSGQLLPGVDGEQLNFREKLALFRRMDARKLLNGGVSSSPSRSAVLSRIVAAGGSSGVRSHSFHGVETRRRMRSQRACTTPGGALEPEPVRVAPIHGVSPSQESPRTKKSRRTYSEA